MDEVFAITEFLQRALSDRRKRYLDFIARPKARPKLLGAIYHDLAAHLNRSLAVERLPEALLDLAGYRYSPPKQFGEPISSLRELLESHNDSFLAITRDGKAGIYRPETFIDAQLLFNFSQPRATTFSETNQAV